MTTIQRLEERLFSMERTIDGLQHELLASQARSALRTGEVTMRLAEAATSTPTTGDNTFSIVFLDGKYPETVGSHTPSYLARQNFPGQVCHNLAGGVPPMGTKIPVFRWSGRWWTFWSTGSSPPPPPASDKGASNIFFGPHWYNWGGVNNGQLASTGLRRRACPSQGDQSAYYVWFQNRVGPEIGVEVGPAYNQAIRIKEGGVYQFSLRVGVIPGVWVDSPSQTHPDPQIPLAGEVQIGLLSEGNREPVWPYSNFVMCNHYWLTGELPQDLSVFGGQLYVNFGQLANWSLSGELADLWDAFTPPTTRSVYFTMHRVNQTVFGYTDNLDYGVEFTDPCLIVTRVG